MLGPWVKFRPFGAYATSLCLSSFVRSWCRTRPSGQHEQPASDEPVLREVWWQAGRDDIWRCFHQRARPLVGRGVAYKGEHVPDGAEDHAAGELPAGPGRHARRQQDRPGVSTGGSRSPSRGLMIVRRVQLFRMGPRCSWQWPRFAEAGQVGPLDCAVKRGDCTPSERWWRSPAAVKAAEADGMDSAVPGRCCPMPRWSTSCSRPARM